MDYALLWAVLGGIALLLILIFWFKLPAFLALLLSWSVMTLLIALVGFACISLLWLLV